ncbi:F-box/LRR-repeat protein At3g26922 [Populus alba]|uniref:F-box family protein n=1 Tax=Populus alba TaxID=43335 RepID=A0A4U5P6Y8_POPAL|nr:F-box/LRR-repeat protein At3g26922-like [Populus alba]TKR91294.1 F-box family protein [Populus alba]
MEAKSLTRKTKRKKLKAEKGTDSGEKSFGNLPDALLEHILSFVSTAAAVRTSILSKKWLHLWKSTPNLTFFGLKSPKRKLFMDFVDRVLALRGPSNIEKFYLSCKVKDDPSRVGTWISAAVNRNVKDLYLELCDFEASFNLPHCLFNCETLTELEINMPYILKLPSSISLSCLKILNLYEVTFTDDHSTQQLFSLPNLVELELHECNWMNLMAVSISAPKLQSLDIYEPCQSSPASLGGCHVRIFRTDLTHFTIIGTLSNDYCLYESSVVETCISIFSAADKPRQTAYRASKLLEGISSAQSLCLTTNVVDVLDDAPELLAFPLEFTNLTSLMFESEESNLHSDGFWHIIYNSPHLVALQLYGVSMPKVPSNCREDWTLDPSPPCFLSCLKFIQVASFRGDEKELDAVGFLLKNATALESMDIIYSGSAHRDEGVDKTNKIHQQLLAFPRWSKIGKIDFD